MALVAVLSCRQTLRNPAALARLRDWCAHAPQVFHYELDDEAGLANALSTIARVGPRVLVVNGGDPLVRGVLTEIEAARPFGEATPPIAVLPDAEGGNLIAMNLNAMGDPVAALERCVALAQAGDLAPYVETRELIALRRGEGARPVLGMFLGGADLAEAILWCRRKLYPLGLPDRVSHALALFTLCLSSALGLSFLSPRGREMRVTSAGGRRAAAGLLFVTTLDRMFFGCRALKGRGLRLMTVERGPLAMLRLIGQSLIGRLGRTGTRGVHVGREDRLTIDGHDARVLLDGELFVANDDAPILLSTTEPVAFLRLAA